MRAKFPDPPLPWVRTLDLKEEVSDEVIAEVRPVEQNEAAAAKLRALRGYREQLAADQSLIACACGECRRARFSVRRHDEIDQGVILSVVAESVPILSTVQGMVTDPDGIESAASQQISSSEGSVHNVRLLYPRDFGRSDHLAAGPYSVRWAMVAHGLEGPVALDGFAID